MKAKNGIGKRYIIVLSLIRTSTLGHKQNACLPPSGTREGAATT
jgi:hypothetical protein